MPALRVNSGTAAALILSWPRRSIIKALLARAIDKNTRRLRELCSRPCWKLGAGPEVEFIESIRDLFDIIGQLRQLFEFAGDKAVFDLPVGRGFHALYFASFGIE